MARTRSWLAVSGPVGTRCSVEPEPVGQQRTNAGSSAHPTDSAHAAYSADTSHAPDAAATSYAPRRLVLVKLRSMAAAVRCRHRPGEHYNVNVFLSSVIGGFETYRDAAAWAVSALGHDVKRAEDYTALPESAQSACLAGIRDADVVILLLGRRYGVFQQSGMSATHEEYREGKKSKPILAFVQADITPEQAQAEFIEEVRSWEGGHFTGSFSNEEQLRQVVTRALHELELAQRTAPPDESGLSTRIESLKAVSPQHQGASLVVLSAPGPLQQLLRPNRLDDPSFRLDLAQQAMRARPPIFQLDEGTTPQTTGDYLTLRQSAASLVIDATGAVSLAMPAVPTTPSVRSMMPVLIEEYLSQSLLGMLAYHDWLLSEIDPVGRISHVLIQCELHRASYMPWRTQQEHAESPNSASMGQAGDSVVVTLAPAIRHRSELRLARNELAEDLLALLRRRVRPS